MLPTCLQQRLHGAHTFRLVTKPAPLPALLAALLANKTFDFNVGKLRTVLLNLRDRLAKKDEKLQVAAATEGSSD
jgi:hypothetical protein